MREWGGHGTTPDGIGWTGDPPLDRWAEEQALRELARLARDLPYAGAAEVWRRLGRLTGEQRAAVIAALRQIAGAGRRGEPLSS
jgi:hypothetical protein